jgi:hypothetical protein
MLRSNQEWEPHSGVNGRLIGEMACNLLHNLTDARMQA